MSQWQFQIPNQRRPETEWTKKLYVEHANRMIHFVGEAHLTEKNNKIAECYRAWNCELSANEEKVIKSVQEQYGSNLGVEYSIYPLAEMVVDQLTGEYLSVEIAKKVFAINKDAINKKLDTKLNYIMEDIFREQHEKMKVEDNVELTTDNPEIELPDDVEEFFAKNYKTHEEELGDDLSKQYIDVLGGKHRVKTLLQDYLIGEQCTGFITEKYGHPYIERAKYDECYVDLDPDSEIHNNVNIFAFFPFKTQNEILNEYDLDDKQRKKVEDMFQTLGHSRFLDHPFSFNSKNMETTSVYQNCEKGVSYRGWYEENITHRLRIMKMHWKSRKEVKVIVYKNKFTRKENYKILKPGQKPRKRDTVKTISVEVERFVHMLGPELCLDYGISQPRMTYVDDKKTVVMPVVALRGRNTMYSNTVRSVVARVIPLQRMASDILFELRLAIKANNGNILVYDVSQIPKQFLDTYGKKGAINRMLHHIKKDKILLFNSKDRNSRATFNQFTSLNLTNKGQIQDLVNAMMLIETLALKFVGMSPERLGESQKYQTATANERAVLGSTARTEIFLNPFDNFVKNLLDRMFMKAKHIYKKGDVFPVVFGDLKQKFLQITENFLMVDLGMFMGDRYKERRSKEIIDQAATQALGNAQDKELILDLINVLDADTASKSKAILEKGLKALAELSKSNQEQLKAIEDAKIKDNETQREHEMSLQELKNEGLEAVAKIKANADIAKNKDDLTSKEIIEAARLENERLKQEKEELSKVES